MTTNFPTINLTYPGMLCNGIEFFTDNNGTKVIQNGKVLPFCEVSLETINFLEKTIQNDKAVHLALHDMHPNSKFKRIEQFVNCRFGGLDFQADIKEGKLQDGEYWDCPKRGSCSSEGILCKLPTYNGSRLENQEVKLLQLTATNKKNQVIADLLNLPLGSFHKVKQALYFKLNIQTKQEGVMISFMLNLIRL